MGAFNFGQNVARLLKTAANVYYGGGKTQAELADEDDMAEMRQMLPPVPAPGTVTRTRTSLAGGTPTAPPVTTTGPLRPAARQPVARPTLPRPPAATRPAPVLPKGPGASRDLGGFE